MSEGISISQPLQTSVLTRPNRWTLSEIQRDSLQRELPIPNEASARQHWFCKGVDAPDLVTIKDSFRRYIATSRGKIDADERSTPIPSTPLLSSSSPASPVSRVHRQMKKAGAKSTKEVLVRRDTGDATSQSLVGLDNAHYRGSSGEYKEATSSSASHRDRYRCPDSPGKRLHFGYKHPAAPPSEDLLFHFLDSSLLAKRFSLPASLSQSVRPLQ